jgi:hypothetical protein
MSEVTDERMTLQEALLLASIETNESSDQLRLALRLLGQEYHKQSMLVTRQAILIRKLQRAAV